MRGKATEKDGKEGGAEEKGERKGKEEVHRKGKGSDWEEGK